jgi:excisionase family DNA binding protein
MQKGEPVMNKTSTDHDHIQNGNRLLIAEEVAELLNIRHSFAYKLMQTGQIPIVRLGRACRVRPQDLADYIEKNIQQKIVYSKQSLSLLLLFL